MINFSFLNCFFLLGFFSSIIECTNLKCDQTSSCLMEAFRDNPTKYISKCLELNKACDNKCLSLIKNYQTCTQSCNCLKPDEEFKWDCIDNCKNLTNSLNFQSFVNCIYKPCRNNIENNSPLPSIDHSDEPDIINHEENTKTESNENSFTILPSFILSFVIIFFIIIAFVAYKRWKSYKSSKIGKSDYEIAEINSFTN